MKCLVGDLTRVEADVLVNAANGLGPMGGGVAGALRRTGGREIEDEAIAVCRREDPQPGEVYVTGAGRLRARYIFHAVTMKRPAERSSLAVVEKCLLSLLEKARQYGVRSIALPALATGVGGVPREEVARAFARILGPVTDLEITVVDVHPEFIALVEECLQEMGQGRG
ncbi:MAG: macro domain-containing protein [Clostridia bacterium]|jgi:O-acetyl-ADP-ribose deacetylase (regulator of RNase III)|nr:macro domain-containing protein [Clostridia bacterium]MDH7572577.1 macro domain-containing protein [Clostridia bacterium]